jgi:hypothetical protein
MIKKIKSYALTIVLALTFVSPGMAPLAIVSACSGTASSIQAGANGALGSSTGVDCSSAGSTSDVGSIAKNVVNVFSFIVGAVAVIMIIYGGFRYVTSGGESGAVGNAKNTLVYAIVGLVIVALAQLIVHYVLAQTNVAQ